MKLVIQRVLEASVEVDSKVVGSIDKGLLVLVGVSKDFDKKKLEWMVHKVLNLRLWASGEKGFDLSVSDIKGKILVVSQFTLHGIVEGNKPNFKNSAGYDDAKRIYDEFVFQLKESGLKVETGEFGAIMKVKLINDGPVTLVLEK